MILANKTRFMVFCEIFLGNFGAFNPITIWKENITKGTEIKLGNGGGRGINIGKAKTIKTKPKPPEFIAVIISSIEILSLELLLIASSSGAIFIDFFF